MKPTPISTNADVIKFRQDLFTQASKSRKKERNDVFLNNLDTANLLDLKQLDMTVDALRPTVYLSLFGDIGIYSALMLSRKFKRIGYKGYSINFSVPVSVSASDKINFHNRILDMCDQDKRADMQKILESGATISVEDAKNLGLIDYVKDPLARARRKPGNAQTAPASETSNSNSSTNQIKAS